MTERTIDADKKLNMSLDALIGQSRQGDRSAPKGRGGRGGRGGGSGRGGGPSGQGDRVPDRASQQRGGGRGRGRQAGLTNSGLIMPNFGMPFGGFQGGQSFDPRRFGPPMPPDGAMNGLPMPMMPPPFFGQGPFGRGMPMPPQEPYAAPEPPRPSGPAAVPQAQLDEASGEVSVSFKGKQIVKIVPSGAITLDTGGVRGPAVFMALNAVLNVVGVSITRPKKDDEWSISDGRSLTRFRDGVVLAPKGPQAAQRGHKIVAAFGGADPSAAAAATAASNAAAAAAGIVLPGKGGPVRGPLQNGRPRQPGQVQKRPNSATPHVDPEEADRIRRLKAKGRYTPY